MQTIATKGTLGPFEMTGRPGQADGVVVPGVLREPDWDLIRAFVRGTDGEDLRLRFGGSINFDDEAALRRRFGVNAERGDVGWILDDRASIAAILHHIPFSASEAEFALIVRSDLKRTGLGSRMLKWLVRRSSAQRLARLTGFVLRENRPMLRLASKAGFVARQMYDQTVQIQFDLA